MAILAKKGAAPNKLAISLGGDWVYWTLSEQGTRRVSVESLPEEGAILRASALDVVVAPGSARGKRLRTRVLSEVRAEFKSFRQRGMIYATALEHVRHGMDRVVPLVSVIDAIRVDQQLELPGVVGILIGEGDDALSLAFSVRSTGEVDPPVVVAGHSPSDQEQATEQALVDAGITDEQTDSVWLESPELYRYCVSTPSTSYPLPEELAGLPKARWAQFAVVGAAAVAVFGGAKYWAAVSEQSSLASERQRLESSAPVKPEIKALVTSHIDTLIRDAGVDFESALDDARAIQEPHTNVALSLSKRSISLQRPSGVNSGTITLNVEQSGNDRLPSIDGISTERTQPWPNADGLNTALTNKPPEGWSVGAVETNSSGTIMRVKYDQES